MARVCIGREVGAVITRPLKVFKSAVTDGKHARGTVTRIDRGDVNASLIWRPAVRQNRRLVSFRGAAMEPYGRAGTPFTRGGRRQSAIARQARRGFNVTLNYSVVLDNGIRSSSRRHLPTHLSACAEYLTIALILNRAFYPQNYTFRSVRTPAHNAKWNPPSFPLRDKIILYCSAK